MDAATDFPERFRPGARVRWSRGDATRELIIVGARRHGSRWLLRFEEAADRSAAEALSGGEISVPDEQAVPEPAGFYYSHRIRGWRCETPAGRALGTVEALDRSAAGPLLTVATADGKSVLVPFVEGIVRDMDAERRRVVLDPPEGLFEL